MLRNFVESPARWLVRELDVCEYLAETTAYDKYLQHSFDSFVDPEVSAICLLYVLMFPLGSIASRSQGGS
jgi:hypothetical protein